MIRFGSPLYWLMTLVVAAVLIGGNYYFVSLFTQKIEPAARQAVETRLSVEIKPGWRGFWQVQPESLRDYPDSKFWLKTKVFAMFSVLIFLFVAGIILEIVLIYLAAARLFKASS